MKDTKTVLPTVNGGNGNGDNKNVSHGKNKVQENGTPSEHRSTTLKSNSDSEELVGGCCVCSDDQGFANNALVYCDGKGCTVACHTACYGIVSIPDGDWYCGRCEAGDIRAPCRLCPTTEGAMKRSSDSGWAHVVCALYIPEVSFADDTTMEPIVLSKVPSTRFGQECSICIQNGRSKLVATSGACCGCTVKNCSQVFHVTCAQSNGLLCEDIRKNTCQYPIYCEQHRPKLSKFIRQIPAFQYSPNALASNEQIKRQNLLLKEKESPSQLSDFVAAAAAEAAASESTRLSSSLNDTNNQTATSDEQQPPVPRTLHTSDILQRKSSSNTNSSLSSSTTSLSPGVQHKSHSRSSSSSSTNSSVQKKSKTSDEANTNNNNNPNRSLTDLSQFVQLNKDERNFLPPAPPNQSNEHESNKSHVPSHETKEMISEGSKLSNPGLDQQSSLSSIEEKPLASRFSAPSPSATKSPMKQRQSTDSSSVPIKSITIKKPITTKSKGANDDEDYEIIKKRKLSIKLNKDGQPRKKRQHSADGPPRPVGRPPSKKTLLAQQSTNGIKRPLSKSSSNSNNMKQQKHNDTLITMQDNPSENNKDYETKLTSRSKHYYPCDHFGNQINSDAFQQHSHTEETLQPISSTHGNEENVRSRIPSSSNTPRIEFFPRRPLQMTSTTSSTTDQQSQRTFPPQTLEEFLEQEWESSSDFLLQQTMPHDVSALLSCLYQFKSENASLQKKFDELKHRRDSLRVTNANLRRRLSEILPIGDAISSTPVAAPPPPPPPLPLPASAVVLPATTVTQVSPPPVPLPTMLAVVPPSPRKEQQQLKQQKLIAELELQQQLQQQKAISPSRRRLSTTTATSTTSTSNNHYVDSSQSTIKKTKSPRQSNALTHSSLLESQLRQSPSSTNPTSTKKLNPSATIPTSKKLPASDLELVSHHPTSSATTINSSVLSTTGPTTTTPAYEQINVTTTAAAAAYALAKNGRAPAAAGLNLELLSQILAASGNAISPQLFAPTWNISNFGYANFPGANPISASDESILRTFAASVHPSLEQQQQSSSTSQTSTKPQP